MKTVGVRAPKFAPRTVSTRSRARPLREQFVSTVADSDWHAEDEMRAIVGAEYDSSASGWEKASREATAMPFSRPAPATTSSATEN